MIHGFLICLALAAVPAGILFTAFALCRAASRDQSRLPGGLARDDRWPVVDAWEEHVRTTPGMTDWAAWDRQMEETS